MSVFPAENQRQATVLEHAQYVDWKCYNLKQRPMILLLGTVPDPEMGHLAGISFIEHFKLCVRVGSNNKIELELSQLFY